jgi:hypothetical protein
VASDQLRLEHAQRSVSMKCANCDRDALFEYQITHTKSIFYCGQDLPRFLESRKKAGLLKITSAFTEAKSSALEQLSLETVEAPKPVKKAAKKKAE